MKICLVQYKPFYPKIGMLDSYNEVVDSLVWGFSALGHEVISRINCIAPGYRNIVFGWHVPLQLKVLDTFPEDTIIYNFERYTNYWQTPSATTAIAYLASKYQLWDYNLNNISILNTLNPKFPPYYAKIAYAPNLEKIPTNVEQDIDVLYYGNYLPYRYDALSKVAETRGDLAGLSVMTLRNFWGKQRDEFIARSKVILNISLANDIFEIVRASYLLANKKAIVCCIHGNGEGYVEDDIRNSPLKFVSTSDVDRACQTLVEDDHARAEYAGECYEMFRQRDIREVIANFFS
jgi:hypothetical protein